ncbi:MAG: hypothetical protein RL307_1480 [Pseudomonadota bacterium]
MNLTSSYPVEFNESGQGEAIVFVPGSFSNGASWRGISSALAGEYRTITTSLSGYGKTQERRSPGGDHMAKELDVLDSVLQRVNAPVHLVAHSFGAYVALLYTLRRPHSVMSLSLLEPTVFDLLRLCGETTLNDEVLAVLHAYKTDWNSGASSAVRHIIDFYGGAGTFESYPDPIKTKLIEQTPTNVLDWETGYACSAAPAEISTCRLPTRIICGSLSNEPMKTSNRLLCDLLPNAEMCFLEGANHFMLATHAIELTAQLRTHIEAVSGRGSGLNAP